MKKFKIPWIFISSLLLALVAIGLIRLSEEYIFYAMIIMMIAAFLPMWRLMSKTVLKK